MYEEKTRTVLRQDKILTIDMKTDICLKTFLKKLVSMCDNMYSNVRCWFLSDLLILLLSSLGTRGCIQCLILDIW